MCGYDQLDTDIGDAFSEFFGQVVGNFEAAARSYSLPAFAVKAVHMLGTPMTMKELGQQFHCDPSFVTAIADLLDTHGLAQREPDARDRRIKHLRLTPKGLEFRERVEREVLARMPWNYALDTSERESLLALLRKMIQAENERRSQVTTRDTAPDSGTVPAGRPGNGSGSSDTADDPDTAHDSDTAHDTPPATAGANRAGEVTREPTSATLSGR